MGLGINSVFLLLVSLAIVIFASSVVTVYGEITYAVNNYRLTGTPTYCIEFPENPDLSFNEAENMVNTAQNAVNGWKTALQEKETGNKLKWIMNSKVISGDVPDDCDIHLTFEEKVYSPNSDGVRVIGTTFYGTDKIEIYYIGLAISQLSNIILHEIGHTFGLGHYFSDDNDINKSWYTKIESPSIMIPTMHQDSSMIGIRDVDINKIREIYGSDGFETFAPVPTPQPTPIPTPSPIPTPTPTPIKPIIPLSPFESLEISDTYIEVDNYSPVIVTVTGQIKEQYFLLGQPVYLLVKNPDFTTDVLKIKTTNKGFFHVPMSFNRDSSVGQYEIEGIYLDHTDSASNIDFTVAKKSIPTNQSEIFKKPEPQIPKTADSTSGNYLKNISIVSENNDYIVTSYMTGKSMGASSVRITAENECPMKKEVFQKDYPYKSGMEVSFSFYQLSQGKPEQCSIHFTVSDFNGRVLETVVVDYALEESKTTHNLEELVKPSKIPGWIKDVTSFWCDGLIEDDSYVKGLQYLIDNGIIVVSAAQSGQGISQEIPSWIKNNACWWVEGKIDDNSFVQGLQFLIKQGIIQLN